MKKLSTLMLSFFLLLSAHAQTVLFTDNFESGTANWTLSGNWGLSTAYSFSATNSLTDSPGGNYPDQFTSTATMSSVVDLSTALSADLEFYAIYDIEANFDYVYVEVSGNNGSTWTTVGTFTGDAQLSPWLGYTYSLGAFVGSSTVKVRFRFFSDQAVNNDGIYIDDVKITSYTTDNAPPAIQHTPPVLYESNAGSQTLNASLVDVSGISSTKVYYTVDGGQMDSVSGVNTTGNNWVYTMPSQSPGAWVKYFIRATDASVSMNTDSTQWYSYIAGNYIKYDNGQVDFVNDFGPGAQSTLLGVAVRVTIPAGSDLVTALIRNYTDPTRPNDSMQVHIWSNNNGVPGSDLITPITIFPEATLSFPNAITRVDLRPYSAQLSNLTGDVFVGYTVPVNEVWTQQTSPGTGNRSYVFDGSSWTLQTVDYHFRVVTGNQIGAPVADFNYIGSLDPQIIFTDQSSNSPTSWFWDFDDNGSTSSLQDPTYTFTTNRVHNVCLTATNSVASSTVCKLVTIAGVPPVAAFTWSAANDPTVDFTDNSPDSAVSWLWTFGDGQQSIQQNPSHTYTLNGSYQVCLTITNNNGVSSNPYCDSVTVTSVGIAENQEEFEFSVFPVPSSGSVTLLSDKNIRGFEVIDVAGRTVILKSGLNSGRYLLETRLAPGIYFIRINTPDGNSKFKRLIIR